MTYEMFASLVMLMVLALAIPYVRRIRHPSAKPLAAYMIFVLAFVGVAAVLFAVLTAALTAFGVGNSVLASPIGAGAFLLVIFVPGFLVGRWLVRKPPRRSPMP